MKLVAIILVNLIALAMVLAAPVPDAQGLSLEKRSLFSFIAGLFGDDDSTSSSSAAAVAVATPTTTTAVAATAVSTTAATTSASSSGGGFLSVLGQLFGFGDSSSSSAAAPAATPTPSTSLAVASSARTSTTASAVASPYVPVVNLSTDLPSTTTSSNTGGLFGWLGGASSTLSSTATASAAPSSGSSGSSASGTTAEGGSEGNGSGAGAYVSSSAGITYSPYKKDGTCKTASDVAADMSLLSGVGLIRLYSVDCNGINNVLAALPSGAQVFLGVWNIDNSSIDSDLSTLVSAVEGSGYSWSVVHTIAIGNEQVNAGTATVSQVSSAVQYARSWLESNAPQYSGYVVTVDTLVAVMNNPLMCSISDYLTVNCHPYFSGIEPSTAGTWLEDQIKDLENTCNNGKQVFITETGWPTQGDTIGSSVPSDSNQLTVVKSIVDVVGDQTLIFTMYNDYWKDPGPYGVEQHWGVYGDPVE